MSEQLENPIGLNGFEFIEFSAPEKGLLEQAFKVIGFEHIARHRSKDVDLWRQGGINLITNYEPDSPAAKPSAPANPTSPFAALAGLATPPPVRRRPRRKKRA